MFLHYHKLDPGLRRDDISRACKQIAMKLEKNLVLLVNLGSPNHLSVGAVRRFLRRFLGDRRVVGLPRYLWYPILYGIILPLRAPKLFKQYQKIWINGKSPLVYHSEEQSRALSAMLQNSDTYCRHAFCYANPDVVATLAQAHSEYNITQLIVVPLYPQFSSTTSSAVFDQVSQFYQDKYYLPEIRFVNSFCSNKLYIDAVVAKIKHSWVECGKGDRLLLSYHSLPCAIIANGDAYYDECMLTSKLIAQSLGLNENEYMVTFQSKFGRQKWLTPTTSGVLAELGQQHLAVDIICPGFVSDCLETLEEIKITNQQLFEHHGGQRYTYIECLNSDMGLIKALHDIISS